MIYWLPMRVAVHLPLRSARRPPPRNRAHGRRLDQKPLLGSGQDAADVIAYLSSTPPHVTINDIVVMPTAQAASTQVLREE